MTKRRNTLEALEVIDSKKEVKKGAKKTTKKEMVEMKKEVCVVCGEELRGTVIIAEKGICKGCVVDMMIDNAIKTIVPKYFDINETLGDEAVKEFRLIQAKKAKLNSAIRYAIEQGKVETVNAKYVPYKAIQAIIKNYQVLTGGLMSDEQMMALKKLNPTQIEYINLTMLQAQRKVRIHNFNKRMAVANA